MFRIEAETIEPAAIRIRAEIKGQSYAICLRELLLPVTPMAAPQGSASWELSGYTAGRHTCPRAGGLPAAVVSLGELRPCIHAPGKRFGTAYGVHTGLFVGHIGVAPLREDVLSLPF